MKIYIVLIENPKTDPETKPFQDLKSAMDYAKQEKNDCLSCYDENIWFDEKEKGIPGYCCYSFYVDDGISIRITEEELQ